MPQIHLFIGTAGAGPTNRFSYPEGERHAFLCFSRQDDGAEFDWDLAAELVTGRGWMDVDIQRGGIADPATFDESTKHLVLAYEEALSNGSSLIVYAEPASP